MIIMLRGNHGSGKSTVVRNLIIQHLFATPIFGSLGMKVPEAYCCYRTSRANSAPIYILGPYQTWATCGFDYITKLGVARAEEILEKYRQRTLNDGHIIFESIMTSVRILEPSIGRWIKANRRDVLIVTLTTSLEECARSIEERKTRSTMGTKWNSKHLEAQQRMFERVTQQYKELGFRQEYVSRDNAPEKILGWLKDKR